MPPGRRCTACRAGCSAPIPSAAPSTSPACVPAVWYFYLGLTDQLGADPQNVLERTLGLWALRFLIAALAITPLRRLGGPNLIRYRRAIGLLAFYYATLHLTVYMVLDQGLDFAAIWPTSSSGPTSPSACSPSASWCRSPSPRTTP